MENKELFEAREAAEGLRVDVFLGFCLREFTRSKIAGMIKQKLIKIDGKIVTKAGEKLKCGQIVEVCVPEPEPLDAKPEDLPLNIVFEDEDLAVINKAQGMVVHAGSGNHDKTLVNALLFHIKDLSGINGVLRPGIVHRLDKNTAGLLVVAKNDFAHVSLAKQIEEKTCKRGYIAILEGNPKEDRGVIETHIARHKTNRKIMAVCPETEGKVAITEYKVLERFSGYSLVEFNLKTGRTHQIRVHAKEVLHCPIAGDVEYGGHVPKILFKSDPKSLGQYLVAERLEFVHPRCGNNMTFIAIPPDYFNVLLDRLRENQKY